MIISKEFKKNVQSKDVELVRSALLDYLISDRSFQNFDDSLDFAKKELNIFQNYNGESFDVDEGKWDENYLNRQKVGLMVNFCPERIEHIKRVIGIVLSKYDVQPNALAKLPEQNIVPKNKTGRNILPETPVGMRYEKKTNYNQQQKYQTRYVRRQGLTENVENLGKLLIIGGTVLAVGAAVAVATAAEITVTAVTCALGAVAAGGAGAIIKNKKQESGKKWRR